MLESCITSFIDGRVRLRHPLLRDAATAERVRMMLASVPGVLAATVHCRPGSLLLEYDPTCLDKKTLLGMMRRWESLLGLSGAVSPQVEGGCRSWLGVDCVRAQRVVNRGMLASLAASLGLLLAGNGRGHAVAGGVFLALNACHLYYYRKNLLR